MKVYVITKGCYSDYHICAVADDRGKAEHLKKLFTDDWDEADIEEYDTDDHFPIEYPYFHVCVENGEVTVEEEETVCDYGVNVLRKAKRRDKPVYYMTLKAKDAEHAKKIVLDRIAQRKAEQLGL